ncbi:hypothetical protein KA107_01395 [Candidatus Pacearchaeota archaeon]|nr:hypothetical protein [Candidatus Pacearchaeota archaeon]
MQDIKQDILSVLREKGTTVSTSDILNSVSKEYSISKFNGEYSRARQIRRKFLYHLNKLAQEELLQLDKFSNNGEKHFVLNVSIGEEPAPTKYKKEFLPPIPIEGYEQKGIIQKYGQLTEKINSVVVLCDKYHEELLPVIKKLLFIVDDCICLENFADNANKKNSTEFIKELDKECSRYGKKISLSIDLENVEKERILTLIKETISLHNIHFIFGIEKNSLNDKRELIHMLLEIYAKEKKKIFIKNKDKFNLPYFIGNAGVYSFDEDEWNSIEDKPIFIACSQSTVIVDVKKFYDHYGFNLVRFKELLMNISTSFLSLNPIQRKKIRDYFKDNIPNYHRDFLELSRNYVRLWNFGLLEPELEKEKVLEIIGKSKEKIDDFTQMQDRIYNSCGMPIRLKIALNEAAKTSGKDLSSAKFSPMKVENFNSILNELEGKIGETVKVSSYFDGGVHAMFQRVGKIESSKELLNEVSHLINNNKLAFFSYDLRGVEYG